MQNNHPAKSKMNILMPLFMVIFIDTLGMSLILPILAPLFSLDLASHGLIAWNISQTTKNMLYGITMAVYPIFMFFASPLLGDLSDRVGRKKILLVCLCGTALGSALSGAAIITHSFILFFISRIIAGAMAGSLPTAQAAIADISDEHDKTINLSFIGLAYTLGVIFGPTIGSILANNNIVSWFGFSTPLFVTTILALGNALVLAITFRETVVISPDAISWKSIRIVKPLIMFIDAFRNPSLRNIALGTFFYILAWSAYLQFIVLYLFQKYNFSAMQLGYFTSCVGAVMSLAMLFIIRILVRFLTTKQIIYFAIMLSFCGILVGMLPNVILQWISVIPIACGCGLAWAAIMTLFSNAVSSDLQGWVMGISSAIMAASAAVAGLLVAAISSYHLATFIFIIVLWVVAFLLFLQVAESERV
jgi:MFS transporter, DHA1 family, tetracycline resistance protein